MQKSDMFGTTRHTKARVKEMPFWHENTKAEDIVMDNYKKQPIDVSI